MEGTNGPVQCHQDGIVLSEALAHQEDLHISHLLHLVQEQDPLPVLRQLLLIRGELQLPRDLIHSRLSISQSITGLHQQHQEPVQVHDLFITVQTDLILQATTARG